jgi:hypothetical protein
VSWNPHPGSDYGITKPDIHGQKMDIMEPKWQNLAMTCEAVSYLAGRLRRETEALPWVH